MEYAAGSSRNSVGIGGNSSGDRGLCQQKRTRGPAPRARTRVAAPVELEGVVALRLPLGLLLPLLVLVLLLLRFRPAELELEILAAAEARHLFQPAAPLVGNAVLKAFEVEFLGHQAGQLLRQLPEPRQLGVELLLERVDPLEKLADHALQVARLLLPALLLPLQEPLARRLELLHEAFAFDVEFFLQSLQGTFHVSAELVRLAFPIILRRGDPRPADQER